MVNLAHCESRTCRNTKGKRQWQGHWSKTTKRQEEETPHDEIPSLLPTSSIRFTYSTCIIQILPGPAHLDDLPPAMSRCHYMLTKQSVETGPSLQMSFLSSSPRVGGFVLVPSSWKESVIQTNSEVSHNYRLVSTDFHQQLCMWWSGRNVNESSIGVNQLQALQWAPQHSPGGPLRSCQMYNPPLGPLWWGQRTIRQLFCSFLPLGFIKENASSAKSFIFYSKFMSTRFTTLWLGEQSLHLISRAISSSDRPPRGSQTQRNSSANGSWRPLCSF